jgi:acetyl esterase/lipase
MITANAGTALTVTRLILLIALVLAHTARLPAAPLTEAERLLAQPFRASIALETQDLRISWPTQLGCVYQLQSSSDLVLWQDLGAARNGDGFPQDTLMPVEGARRFHRVFRTCTDVPTEAINLAYPPPPGGNQALSRLDLYYRPDGGPKRLAVFVHGGSWVSGDKSNLRSAASFVPWFEERGYVVAALNFRLASPMGQPLTVSYAQQAADIAHALAWLDEHGGEYGVSETGMVLVGYSSGAHLVALLAADQHYLADAGLSAACLAAAISLDVHVYDVPFALQLMQGSEIEQNIPLIQHLFGQTSQQQLLGSPSAYASVAPVPPSLLVSVEPSAEPGSHGYITAACSQRHQELLTSTGHTATWQHFDNETHSSLIMNFGAAGDGPTAAMETFLENEALLRSR